MRRSHKMLGLLLISCSLSIASCASKPDHNAPIGPATLQCSSDCVPVSKAFVKEHADLFDELIRTRAALARCHETP